MRQPRVGAEADRGERAGSVDAADADSSDDEGADSDRDGDPLSRSLHEQLRSVFPDDFSADTYRPEQSGKLDVLCNLLHLIRTETRDRVVLVSNYTQMLDVFERICAAHHYSFLRLDGATSTARRQHLVESFNSPFSKDCT